jgi:hypothetical protein
MPFDRQRELKKYRRLIAFLGLLSLVTVIGSYLLLATYFTLVVAYLGSAVVGVPLLFVLWRLDSRYGDLQFRDDL